MWVASINKWVAFFAHNLVGNKSVCTLLYTVTALTHQADTGSQY